MGEGEGGEGVEGCDGLSDWGYPQPVVPIALGHPCFLFCMWL